MMESEKSNKRTRFTIRWSPLLLVPAVGWLYFCWRDQPISVAYIAACVVIGLLYGGLNIMAYKEPLLIALAIVVFASGPMLIGLFFPKLDVLFRGKETYQYMSTVFVSSLCLVVILRGRIMRRLAQADVEQIVKPVSLFSNRPVDRRPFP